MDKLARKRVCQLFQYGWPQSKEIAKTMGVSRLSVFLDMIRAYREYHLWSNQYKKEGFYRLGDDARKEIGEKYKAANDSHDAWVRDKFENKAFLYKYTTRKWDVKPKWDIVRNDAYRKRYNMGKGCSVSTNVVLERNHFLNGTIKIGKNVLLSKNVYIDYSGEVVLSDDVKLSAGVTIESHLHEYKPGPSGMKYEAKPTKIVIGNGVWIGLGAIICESCDNIGRFAQIGAGAIVRNSVPPYSLVVGNPAKVVGFVFNPKEVEKFEMQHYPHLQPTDLNKFELDYNRLFINRIKDIKQFTKL